MYLRIITEVIISIITLITITLTKEEYTIFSTLTAKIIYKRCATSFWKRNFYKTIVNKQKILLKISQVDIHLKHAYGDYMKLPPVDKRIPYPSEDVLENCKFEDEVS